MSHKEIMVYYRIPSGRYEALWHKEIDNILQAGKKNILAEHIKDKFTKAILGKMTQNLKEFMREQIEVRIENGFKGGSNGQARELSWIKIARQEIGVTENTSKTKHNLRIIEYHSTTGKFQDDETPWCSSFVNWVMIQAGLKGTNSARAASWKNWGQTLDKPAYGCIGIRIRANGTGHVAFVIGKMKNGKLIVLGGNQNDSVNCRSCKSGYFHHYVYPTEFEPNYDLPLTNENIPDIGATR